MVKRFLRFGNGLFSFVTALALAMAVLYAGYALWDNGQIYAAAENVMTEAQSIKGQLDLMPRAATVTENRDTKESAEPEQSTETDNGNGEAQETELQAMFRQLQAINPDICAWVTMQGTAIDYPVVHSANNIDYVSTDIYGRFAIVGSIFLDFRNIDDGTDTYNLLYGHNMSEHRMFSDVNLYKEEKFFNENHRGAYYTPEGAHWLETISIILTNSGDSIVFNPEPWERISYDDVLENVQKNAVFINEAGLEALKAKIEAGVQPHIVALSTCSNEFTEARTILLTLMNPDVVSTAEQ